MEIFILKPDFLGFIFYPFSPRFIKKYFPIPNFCEVKKIGVFVNSDEKYVLQKIENYRLDLIQLHGNEDVKFCYSLYSLDKKNIKIIKAFNVDQNFSFDQIKKYRNCVDYFLFDTKTSKYGGSGKKFFWKKLDEYYFDIPFFLSGGITINDTDEILKLSHPKLFCLDINSHFEITPGFKNRNLISNFITKIR
ncbi:phosphoribosylanthranilate isomerase [Candidatus Walczuchella monophlebidarum]|uniref:N-(5'-phosphoribosyl)anthranilate isomerase n=2 Tax=Candidatus Walczuchella monophlebidarum TaxID=1415657 RepID=A0A068DS45_9FLAO|nr:phosphoribosylanthranilate isomerase [Candidatus Walczuchella monophlebidarum]